MNESPTESGSTTSALPACILVEGVCARAPLTNVFMSHQEVHRNIGSATSPKQCKVVYLLEETNHSIT